MEAAEIKKSEEAVKRTMDAIENFTNPFTIPDKDRLYCLASGAPAPPEVEIDVLRAESAGNLAKKTFIQERLEEKSTEFFEPIHKLKLLTMEARNKSVKLTSTKGKVNMH